MLVNAPPFVQGFILLLSLLWWTGCSGVSHQTQNKLKNNNKSGEVAEQGPKHVTRPEPPTGSPPVFKSEALTLACTSTGVNWSYHGGKLLEHAQIQVVFWG